MTAAGLAVALILFLSAATVYRALGRRYRTLPAVPPSEADTICEFQRRRTRLLYWGVIPFVISLCATLLIGPIPYYPLQHDVAPVLGLVVLASGLGTLSLAVLIYRCPACTQIPRGGRFVDLNPKVCAGCGARLKRETESE